MGDRHNPNTELIAQGAANIASAAFGALPVTGALARTAANVKAGARSPVSGMVHSVTILAVILVASPLAQYVPLPSLAAVLVVVAINMGEVRRACLGTAWAGEPCQWGKQGGGGNTGIWGGGEMGTALHNFAHLPSCTCT